MSKSRECLLHDANAASDRKMMCVLEMSGPTGYGLAWLIIETMRRDKDLCFDRSDVSMYARIWNSKIEDINSLLDVALSVGLFVELSQKERVTAPALIRDVAEFQAKREKWRKEKERTRTKDGHLKLSGTDKEEEEQEEDTDPEIEIRDQKKTKTKSAKAPTGEGGYVWLTEDETERLIAKFGDNFAYRCIERLDGWIAQDPTPKRIKNGRNGAATLRAWVIAAVAAEQAKAEKIQEKGRFAPENKLQRDLRAIEEM